MTSAQKHKPVPSLIPSSLKVDNLRHIHDHGLSVVFTDPKLSAMVEFLDSRDGVTKLFAGKSSLTVTRLGRVTLTEAFWNVGTRHVAAIHYKDSPHLLKFSLSRENCGDRSRNAFDTLRAVIFGGKLPEIFRPRFGACQDKLRDFLKEFAWTLTGESGMRSRSLALAGSQLGAAVTSAKNSLSYAERELARLRENTAESFRTSHENIRLHCANRLSAISAKMEQVSADCAVNFSALSEEQLKDLAAKYGAYSRYIGSTATRLSGYAFAFSAIPESISPPRIRNNYVATIAADGETITFNSGVKCPFTVSRLLAWLRGAATAPVTPYGQVKKLERTSRDGAPVVVLQCGCHEIDAVATSPSLFGELLKPTHAVTVVAGKDSAVFGTPEFLARLSEEMADRRASLVDERSAALIALATRKHELTQEEESLPARISQQMEKVESERLDLTKAQQTLSAFVTPLGACAEDAMSNALAVLAAFSRF
jgi:hypothetical protein